MRRTRHLWAATVAAALAAAAGSAPAADEREAPPAPSRHPVVLWAFDDDAARPEFPAAVRSIGADSVQCASDRDPAPFRAAGLRWYEDDAAGKGTLALRDRDVKPAWEKAWAARREAWPAADARTRPVCLGSAESWFSMIERATPQAERGAAGALWVSLADEPGMGARANPTDWCLCDACVAAFVSEARDRSENRLEWLNASWGTAYRSWAEVRPWTTAAIRARELGKPPSQWNLAPWMDTREFQDARVATAAAVVARGVRRLAGEIPCGLSGLQTPSAFGGFDLGALCGPLDFAEPYDIGLALPIVRDLARPRVLAQTVFPDGADGRTSRWRLWRGIARGANATIVWSSHDAVRWDAAAKSYAPTGYGRALAPDLRRLSAPGGLGDRLAATASADAGVTVLVSQPSVRVRWMLDSIEDGDTWMRRFGSWEAAHSTAIASRESAWLALAQRGARFADAAAFLRRPESEIPDGPPQVVVLPDAIALDDGQVSRLELLARRGWLVVADVPPAQFDTHGRAQEPGVRGCVVDPGFGTLAARVEKALGPATLRATVVRSDGGAPPTVEVGLRTARDGRTTYAVCVPMWDVRPSDDGSATGEIARVRLTWTFAFGDGRARAVVDELSGAPVAADAAATWTMTTDAAAPVVVSWR